MAPEQDPTPRPPADLSLHYGGGSTPIPDPTALTTAALAREFGALKELFITRLDAMDKAQTLFDANLNRVPTDTDKQISHLKQLHDQMFEEAHRAIGATQSIIETRLNAMDKAIQLLQDIADDFLNRVAERIEAVKGNHEEKFQSIQVQFRERDVRTEQSSKDSKVAVDAALQAAKEAVGEQNKSSALAIAKSEASTAKTIDSINQLIMTTNAAMNDKFDDIKERLTRIEGKGEGRIVSDTGHHTNNAFAVTVVSVVIALIAVIMSIIGFALRK